MDYKDILHSEDVKALLYKGNNNLKKMGYTDHSEKHCAVVAKRAGMLLSKLGYSKHDIELAEIAGALHDIGNVVNRKNHAEYGAILAYNILEKYNMPLEDRIIVLSAIGNHDESTGGALDVVSAAVIIADKTDVRRNRVIDKDKACFDKHDRVNYAVTNATVKVSVEKKLITLNLQIDEDIVTMYEYFEIFLGRMMMCRKAAELLGTRFKLTANGRKVL